LRGENNVHGYELVDALHKVESEIMVVKSHEIGVVVDRSGREVYRKDGERSEVYIPPEYVRGNIVTHNHPSGECKLSDGDVERIITDDGYEIRAVTFNGRFVSLRRGADSWNADIIAGIKDVYCNGSALEFYKKTNRLAVEKYGSQATVIHRKMVAEELVNGWFRENASKYGCIFTEGLI